MRMLTGREIVEMGIVTERDGSRISPEDPRVGMFGVHMTAGGYCLPGEEEEEAEWVPVGKGPAGVPVPLEPLQEIEILTRESIDVGPDRVGALSAFAGQGLWEFIEEWSPAYGLAGAAGCSVLDGSSKGPAALRFWSVGGGPLWLSEGVSVSYLTVVDGCGGGRSLRPKRVAPVMGVSRE